MFLSKAIALAFLVAAAENNQSTVDAFVTPAARTAKGTAAATSPLWVKARGEGYGPPLDNISEAVGNTPMVKISDKICPEGRTVRACGCLIFRRNKTIF